MAIILGLGLSSAEEETGELRTIVALPVSRTKIVLHKWLAMVAIALVMILAIAGALYITMPFVDNAAMPFDRLVPLLAISWLLMVTFGTIPFAVGMAVGKRAAAMAAGVLVVIGSFILTTFGSAVDWLKDYEKLSLLYYFPAKDVVRDGIQWGDTAVLGIVTVVLLLGAVLVFRRRDIG